MPGGGFSEDDGTVVAMINDGAGKYVEAGMLAPSGFVFLPDSGLL